MRNHLFWILLAVTGWMVVTGDCPVRAQESDVEYTADQSGSPGESAHADSGEHAAAGHDESADDSDSQGDHAGGDQAAGHGGNANPLSVDPDLMIFTGIIFLLLLAVLRKFAWGPISTALLERERSIEHQISEAHRSNDEARRLLAEHEARLAQAAEEIKEMTDQARRDADSRKQEIIAQAEAAAQSQKERALREIHAATNSALEQLAKSSVDQAVGLASRIVGQKLNQSDHTNLIQEALKQFPSEN